MVICGLSFWQNNNKIKCELDIHLYGQVMCVVRWRRNSPRVLVCPGKTAWQNSHTCDCSVTPDMNSPPAWLTSSLSRKEEDHGLYGTHKHPQSKYWRMLYLQCIWKITHCTSASLSYETRLKLSKDFNFWIWHYSVNITVIKFTLQIKSGKCSQNNNIRTKLNTANLTQVWYKPVFVVKSLWHYSVPQLFSDLARHCYLLCLQDSGKRAYQCHPVSDLKGLD